MTSECEITSNAFNEVIKELFPSEKKLKLATDARAALQLACEGYICQVFQDASLCTSLARRQTLIPLDIHVAVRLRRSGGDRLLDGYAD